MKNEDHFGGSYFANCGKIVYCEADGSYSDIIFLNGEKHKISKNLIQISMHLPRDMFFRCHRSFLVNSYRITGFDIGTTNFPSRRIVRLIISNPVIL